MIFDMETLEAQNLERRKDAEAVAAKMSDLKVTLIRQASESLQLYGSVTSRDIADAAAAAGVKLGALFGPQHGFRSDLQENMIE